jgi:hypothetical protein
MSSNAFVDATTQSAQSFAGSSDLFGPLSETLPFASRRRVATLRSLSATSVEDWAITATSDEAFNALKNRRTGFRAWDALGGETAVTQTSALKRWAKNKQTN